MNRWTCASCASLVAFLITASPARAATDAGRDPPPARVRAWQTGAFAPDRLQHASLAFSSGLAIGILTREPVAAGGGALALGVAKELADLRHGRLDRGDLLADLVGASFAALATSRLRR
jgi:hypothetical protein